MYFLKTSIQIFLFLSTFFCFCQIKVETQTVTTYQKLSEYKKTKINGLTAKDSLNIRIIGNDTLIMIDDYVPPKGVEVPYEMKDSVFLEGYKKIAFNHTKGVFSEKTTMKYWKSEIKIFFSENINNILREQLTKYADELSKGIDSLKITTVSEIEKSNYIIYNDEDDNYEKNLSEKKNYNDYYIYWNRKNQIYKGAVKLVSNKPTAENLTDLKRLFALTLGYFNTNNDLPCESFFSNCKQTNELNKTDKEYLKYHYSYGICKGTNIRDFEESHFNAKKTLKDNPNNKFTFIHPYD